MLLQFSFGNYRSFRDRVTLDMTAVPKLHKNADLDAGNVVQTERNGGVLRVAAIYGANASGKSNVILALADFRENVAWSANRGFDFHAIPFLLDGESDNKTTFYEIVFLLDSVQHRYGCELKGGFKPVITHEWLYKTTSSREALLFERDHDKIIRGSRFTEGSALLNKGRLLRPESLYLSLMAQNGLPLSRQLTDYISNRIQCVSGISDKSLYTFTLDCLAQGRFFQLVNELLKTADTGIDSVTVHIENDSEAIGIVPTPKTERQEETEVITYHKRYDAAGKQIDTVALSMKVAGSEGTKKLFAFAAPLLDTLENGNVLFVDEMDARFHPNLTRAIVQLFQSPTANPKNAQLIFVTHDTNLLDPKRNRFRRDQIWFVEKDRFGASRLYSLAEFKGVRESSEADYLRGVFGAVPFLDGFDTVIEQGFGSDNAKP